MRIGFVNICHSDYIDEACIRIAGQAAQALRDGGVTVIEAEAPPSCHVSALKAGKYLAAQNLDGVILFLGTWLECPNAMSVLREVEHLPLCLWGFPMFEDKGALTSTGSFVSYVMFKGSMERLGYRFTGVMGMPEDAEALREVMSFCRAAGAAQAMKRMRIGLVGYTSMGIYTGTFDHVLMRGKIGPEIVQYDSFSLINRAHAMNDDDAAEQLSLLRKLSVPNNVSDALLIKSARFTKALLDMCRKDGLSGINVKCQYEFSKEYGFVMCVPLSLLTEYGISASCEGDIMCSVSMAVLNLLTGQAVTYGDSINLRDGVLKLSACGFMPFSMGAGRREIRNFMPHPGFKGIQCSFVQRPGQVTVMRLVEDAGSYHMLYFTGEGLETELRQGCMPALDVRLTDGGKEFIKRANGQHYAICYGDITRDLENYAELTGIRAVRL